jgi:hypothetical protein
MEFLTRRDLLALGAAVIEPFAAAQNGNPRKKSTFTPGTCFGSEKPAKSPKRLRKWVLTALM